MYKVKITHFYMVEYIEDDKVMNIEVDLREPIVEIGIECINNWASPNDNESLSQLDKHRIAENVKIFLETVKGMRCEIIY